MALNNSHQSSVVSLQSPTDRRLMTVD